MKIEEIMALSREVRSGSIGKSDDHLSDMYVCHCVPSVIHLS